MMWSRWTLLLLCLSLYVEEAQSIGLRTRVLQAPPPETEIDLELTDSIVEEALMYLDANMRMSMSMSMETDPPTSAPVTEQPIVPPTGTPSTVAPVTQLPTLSPTTVPVDPPTLAPIDPPTLAPVDPPTPAPVDPPTPAPVDPPTPAPVDPPTPAPVDPPTPSPTAAPVPAPTSAPVIPPTSAPSPLPTIAPTEAPTTFPSESPTVTCNLSEEERAMLILSFLTMVSSEQQIDTEGTPQNLAAEWIINEDMRFVCPQDPTLIQRYAMAVFYYSTDGDDWFECSAPEDFSSEESITEANEDCNIAVPGSNGTDAWLTPSSECDWGGVACNDLGFVERIDFEVNGVGGTLPSEIGRLSALKYLLLEEGFLSGVIPTDIGFLTNLEQLDLNFNALTGTLPDTLFRLTNLQQLDLNDNELSGPLSTSISELQQLVFLQVENNEMTGTIPEELANLFLLEVATLEGNQLSGSMPDLVCENRTGLLQVLTADCLGAPSRPSPPYVACECCTACF